ncbi:MAG: hypothetical protein ACLRX6_04085 [Limosilactobacillus pontis]
MNVVWIGQLVALGNSVDRRVILLGKVPDGVSRLNLNLGVSVGASGNGQGSSGPQGSD